LDERGQTTRTYGASDAAPGQGWFFDARRATLVNLLTRVPGIEVTWDYNAVLPGEARPAFWQPLLQRVERTEFGLQPTHIETEVFVVPVAAGATQAAATYLFLRLDDVRSRRAVEDADSPWVVPEFQYRPNAGLRNGPIAVPKPEGIFRILCLGSSTTDQGFDNLSTWPKQLERMMRGEFGPERVEVINAGIRGMRFEDHMKKLPLYASLEPDLIVVYEGFGDVMFSRGQDEVWKAVLANSQLLRNMAPGIFQPTDQQWWQAVDGIALASLRALVYWGARNGIPVAVASIATPDPAVLTPEEHAFLDYNIDRHWGLNRGVPYEAVHEAVERFNASLQTLALDEGAYYIPFAENYPMGLDRFHDAAHIRYHLLQEQAALFLNALRPLVRECLAQQRDPRDLIPLAP